MKDISKIVGNNIKKYRELRNMTQEQLAEELNTTRQSISRYESGERKANQDILFELADIFKVSVGDFFPKVDKRNIIDIYNQLTPPRQIKVYNFAEKQLDEQNNIINVDFAKEDSKTIITNRRTAAGSALHVDDTDARKEVVSSALIPKGADELVEVVGKSMEPLIKDGQEVYMRYQPSVENGEIAIVRIENEGVTCKRVYADNGTITLKSENEEYEDMHFDASQIAVLGKVLL